MVQKTAEKSEGKVGNECRPVEVPEWRAILAEFIGTFLLTFVSIAPLMFDELWPHKLSHFAQVLPAGIMVMVMIYSLGRVSGAHINPAVTLAFALRGSFPWHRVPGYWVAQVTGGLVSAWLMASVFGEVAHVGANFPKATVAECALLEWLLTTVLVLVILATAQENKLIGHNAGLAVGATVAMCGLIGGIVGGGSMNPARSLGPAVVGHALDAVWIFILLPLLGASTAAILTTLLCSAPDGEEQEAAQGEMLNNKR